MNTKPTIDDVLKKSFDGFSPEAPDVWQGISNGIQSAQAAQSGAGLATAAKSSAVVVKVVSAVVAVVGLTTAVVWYKQSDTQPVTNPIPVVEAPANVDAEQQRTVQTENVSIAEELKSESTASSAKTKSSEKQTKVADQQPVAQSETVKDHPPVEMNAHSSQPSKVQSLEVNHPISANPQVQSTLKAEPKMEPKVEVSTQTSESKEIPNQQPPKLPYNPNEGEKGFDKSNIVNVITPDNDGLNDRFVIEINQETFYHLVITDANGQMVFESFDKTQTWDGRDFKTGVLCQFGNYRWVLQYQFKDSDKQRTISGLLKLIN